MEYVRFVPVGDVEVAIIADGGRQIDIPDGIVANASMAEVSSALEVEGYPKGIMPFFFNPVLVNNAGKRALIDTGNGESAFEQSKGAVGQLTTNLQRVGVDRTSINAVIITHFHGDHINGLLTKESLNAFPAAEIHVPAAEWAYWMDDANMREAPDSFKPNFENVRRVFSAIAKVKQFNHGDEVVPGVLAMSTPGHTPGHTSMVISSRSESLIVQGDVTNLPALFVRNPGWHARFDMNALVAESTRRKLYEWLVSEDIPVSGYHFPFPAIARVERQAHGYTLAPV